MTTQQKKQHFLSLIAVSSSEQAISSSVRAAFQRNPTYADTFEIGKRKAFQQAFAYEVETQGQQYFDGVQENSHIQTIQNIAYKLSEAHGDVLIGRTLRIGTVQKALNLWLKIVWCLNPEWPLPPHCPVDRIVLQKVSINRNWTELNSVEEYASWISKIRSYATSQGYSSIAEWELDLWNS